VKKKKGTVKWSNIFHMVVLLGGGLGWFVNMEESKEEERELNDQRAIEERAIPIPESELRGARGSERR